MNTTKFITAINNFVTHTVLVVGDVMLDTYHTGNVNRVSPEAPVPILDLDTVTHKLGGAANVAYNIQALNAKAILLSVIGNDTTAQLLQNKLNATGIEHHLIVDKDRITTQKTRYIAQKKQLLRVDNETKTVIDNEMETQLYNTFLDLVNTTKINAVILEDYNKGVLTKWLINEIINECNARNIAVLVDPKKDNFLEYKNATVFKPNVKEIVEALQLQNSSEATLIEASTLLCAQLNAKVLMVTMADKGILVCTNQSCNIIPARKRSVADVSGAGDTVIATVALAINSNLSWEEIALLCNMAGGAVCEKMGVVPITTNELIKEFDLVK
jgi:D-glycero-beta-D-manno-heptose-7-phosphate kinase